MIGKLTGTIDSVTGATVLMDVNGVGYVALCSARTLRALPSIGSVAALRIETQVREDAISLYGFIDVAEQDWFRLLTTVQGVGAKVALGILGTVGPDQLPHVIASQDKAALTQADGVGPKLALRLVTELKDKVPSFMTSPARLATTADAATPVLPPSLAGDAVSALVNLGYRRAEAFAAVSTAVRREPEGQLDDIIKLALGELSKPSNAA